MKHTDFDIMLVDLGSLFYRRWYATKSQLQTQNDVIDKIDFFSTQFQYVVVCADSPTNWRHEVTADLDRELQYKANRPRKDAESVLALSSVKKQIAANGFPVVQCDGFEADDVIATLVHQSGGRSVKIFSEDKDLYQLVSETVTQMTTGGYIDPAACRRKFAVDPGQMHALLAFAGDVSDNIQGCERVGAGKAAALLEHFGDLEKVTAATEEELIEVPGIGQVVARSILDWDPTMALDLTRLRTDCPIDLGEILATYNPTFADEEEELIA